MKILLLFALFILLVLFHLFQKLFSHTLLVLTLFSLNGIFFFLKLFNIVHDDLGPIVIILRRIRALGSTRWIIVKNLRANIFNSRGSRPIWGLGKRLRTCKLCFSSSYQSLRTSRVWSLIVTQARITKSLRVSPVEAFLRRCWWCSRDQNFLKAFIQLNKVGFSHLVCLKKARHFGTD
jgi:hypothetical protein